MRILFPQPLISSDDAGFRQGCSQGKMPTLLLGCLPRRHLHNLLPNNREDDLRSLILDTWGLFPDIKPSQHIQSRLNPDCGLFRFQSHVSLRKRPSTLQYWFFWRGYLSLFECLMFCFRSAFFCVNSVISYMSTIICWSFIFHLLKTVFLIALYFNISLIR